MSMWKTCRSICCKRRVALAMTVSTACFCHLYDLGFDTNLLSWSKLIIGMLTLHFCWILCTWCLVEALHVCMAINAGFFVQCAPGWSSAYLHGNWWYQSFKIHMVRGGYQAGKTFLCNDEDQGGRIVCSFWSRFWFWRLPIVAKESSVFHQPFDGKLAVHCCRR